MPELETTHNTSPDESSRSKKQVIAEVLGDFVRQGDDGQISRAEKALRAYNNFGKYLHTLSKPSGGYPPNHDLPDMDNAIIAYQQMGNGHAARQESFDSNAIDAEGFQNALKAMDRIIQAARTVRNNPEAAASLQRDKQAFEEAMKGLHEAFTSNVISVQSMESYNNKLREKDRERQSEFQQRPTMEKIQRFVEDGHLDRYQAIVEGASYMHGVFQKQDEPNHPRGDDILYAEEKDKGLLSSIAKLYATKAAALRAIVKGANSDVPVKLTAEEYQSLTEYPAAQLNGNRGAEQGYVLDFKYEAPRSVYDPLAVITGRFTQLATEGLEGDKSSVGLGNLNKIERLKDSVSGGGLMRLADRDAEPLGDLERRYGITPQTVRALEREGAIQVDASPDTTVASTGGAPEWGKRLPQRGGHGSAVTKPREETAWRRQ